MRQFDNDIEKKDFEVSLQKIKKHIDRILSVHDIATPNIYKKFIKKLEDPLLYVGLIGEFSSGKSTLVNSWIGKELLKTDIIQATTSSPTLISYSSEMKIRTLLKSGQWLLSGHITNYDFDKKVSYYFQNITANEEYAKDIKLVALDYNKPVLDENIVIIDTPGANAENVRHAEITAWAVQNLCDVVIVIIPADRPFTETLSDYLKNNLEGSSDKLVFVVTKIDTVRREREVERLLRTIKATIENKLGITDVNIFCFAPQVYMDEQLNSDQNISEERKLSLNREFQENREKLLQTLTAKKQEFLLTTLTKLLDKLLQKIRKKLSIKERQYIDRHNYLMANKLPDLDKWLNTKKNEHVPQIQLLSNDSRNEIQMKIMFETDAFLKQIKSNIFSCDKDQLRNYFENELPSDNKCFVDNIQVIFSKETNSFNIKIATIFEQLGRDFSSIYRKLKVLEQRDFRAAISNDDEHMKTKIQMSNSLKTISEDEKMSENIKNWGGGAVGAAIGTFILPGLGTVVGAWAGKSLASLFSPSIEKMRSDYWEKASEKINFYVNTLKKDISQKIITTGNNYLKSYENKILEYKQTYENLINQIVAEDEKEKEALQNYRLIAEADLENLGLYEKSIKKLINNNTPTSNLLSELLSYANNDNSFCYINEINEFMSKAPLEGEKFPKYFEVKAELRDLISSGQHYKCLSQLSKIKSYNINDVSISEIRLTVRKKIVKDVTKGMIAAVLVTIITTALYWYLKDVTEIKTMFQDIVKYIKKEVL